MVQLRFADKVAVVTGAASGIGRATAQRLIADGATVCLVDSNEAELEATASEVGAPLFIRADVSMEKDTIAYVARVVREYGRVDLFHNNAGIAGRVDVPIVDINVREFDHLMAVNVRGTFLGLRETMKVMKRAGGGSIVVTASLGSLRGRAGHSPYITSKHAVLGLVRCASREGAPLGIRVNAVAPGIVDTPMSHAINEQLRPGNGIAIYNERADANPLKRYGTPDEIANVVTYLLSDETSYVTGAIWPIDAGVSA